MTRRRLKMVSKNGKSSLCWIGSIATFLFLTIAWAVTPLGAAESSFKRIATFPVFLNGAGATNDDETVAEIVAASKNGRTLIYTDSATGNIGFVDITHPDKPRPAGILAMGGEPTSVAVAGPYALVAVNTSPDFVHPSGNLVVVHIASRKLSGQSPWEVSRIALL